MRKFKSLEQAQRFLSAFEPIRDPLHSKQHQLIAQHYRQPMRQQLEDE